MQYNCWITDKGFKYPKILIFLVLKIIDSNSDNKFRYHYYIIIKIFMNWYNNNYWFIIFLFFIINYNILYIINMVQQKSVPRYTKLKNCNK